MTIRRSRTGADLDFCVREDELDDAKAMLRSIGFWPGAYDPETQTFAPTNFESRAKKSWTITRLASGSRSWISARSIRRPPRGSPGRRPFALRFRGRRKFGTYAYPRRYSSCHRLGNFHRTTSWTGRSRMTGMAPGSCCRRPSGWHSTRCSSSIGRAAVLSEGLPVSLRFRPDRPGADEEDMTPSPAWWKATICGAAAPMFYAGCRASSAGMSESFRYLLDQWQTLRPGETPSPLTISATSGPTCSAGSKAIP